MTALLGAIFLASLVGSLHCAGMCGGLVVLCCDGQPVRRSSVLPQVAYNGGRLVTYALLGAVSGAVGAAVDLGGAELGVARFAAWIAGAAMILIGAGVLLRIHGVRFGARLPAAVAVVVQRGLVAARRRPPVVRGLLIGLLTGFLPCGWLYAFVVTAAGTGDARHGAAAMIAFWAGTVPILFVIGVGAQAVLGPLRRRATTLTAVALVVIGIVTIAGRLRLPSYAQAAETAAPAGTISAASVQQLAEEVPPCCREDE